MKQARAFTLVEVLIVVVLLGILAAVVVPTIGKGRTTARESALAADLSMLRRFILIYKSQHLEVAPGYPNGDTSATPTGQAFTEQATLASDSSGRTAARGTAGFPYGPYLSRIPLNPFNHLDTVLTIEDSQALPAVADNQYGWVCKPATGEIRPGNSGTDDSGTAYYAY
jgi:prepilin-type N-terminal cleavage/methylation domain-containing protein